MHGYDRQNQWWPRCTHSSPRNLEVQGREARQSGHVALSMRRGGCQHSRRCQGFGRVSSRRSSSEAKRVCCFSGRAYTCAHGVARNCKDSRHRPGQSSTGMPTVQQLIAHESRPWLPAAQSILEGNCCERVALILSCVLRWQRHQQRRQPRARMTSRRLQPHDELPRCAFLLWIRH